MKIEFSVTGAPEAATMLQERGDRFEQPLTDVLQSISILWETDFRSNFEKQGANGEPWVELAPMTQRLRTWKGFNPTKPILVRTHGLQQSIRQLAVDESSMTVGTNLEYAPVLHFGGEETSPNDVPGTRTIPARPFVVLTPDLIEETMATFHEYLFGEGASAN